MVDLQPKRVEMNFDPTGAAVDLSDQVLYFGISVDLTDAKRLKTNVREKQDPAREAHHVVIPV